MTGTLLTSKSPLGARPGRLARLSGVLVGASSADACCVWLATATGVLTPVVWPAGFSANFNPIEILDAMGNTVARGGDRVVLGGGYVQLKARQCMLGNNEAFCVQQPIVNRGPVPD